MKIYKNRLLLIGAGRIFNKHIEVIHKLKNNFEISGIVENDINQLNQLKKKYNYPFYKSLDKALENVEFDIGCILTDSGSHGKIALQILRSNKSVIIEKPIAISLKEAELITDMEKKNKNIHVFTVKQNRFNVAIVKLKEAIEKKRFGKIFLATTRVRWRRDPSYYKMASWRGKWISDGGVLCNQSIHHVDLLQWLVGDIKNVYSVNSKVTAPIQAEDTATAILKYKNGATGIIEATTACRPSNLEGSISILGTKGSVVIGGFSANKILEWQFTNKIRSDKFIHKFSENPKDVYGFGHVKFYEYVNLFFKKKKKGYNFLNAKEGTKSLRIVTALVKSNETGKVVDMGSNLYNTKLGNKNSN